MSTFSSTSRNVLSSYFLKMIWNSECLKAMKMVLTLLLDPFLPWSLIQLLIRDVISGKISVRKKMKAQSQDEVKGRLSLDRYWDYSLQKSKSLMSKACVVANACTQINRWWEKDKRQEKSQKARWSREEHDVSRIHFRKECHASRTVCRLVTTVTANDAQEHYVIVTSIVTQSVS